MSFKVTNKPINSGQLMRPNTSNGKVLSHLETARLVTDETIGAGAFNIGIGSPQRLQIHKALNETRFVPYEHPTTGKSQVHIRGRGNSEDAYVTLQYDPKKIPVPSKELPRSEILLSGTDPKILKQAQRVVREIRKEWKVARALKAEYKAVRSAYHEELKGSVRLLKSRNPQAPKKIRYLSTPEKDRLRNEMSDLKRVCEAHPFASLYIKNNTTTMEEFTRVFNEKIDYLISEGKVNQRLKSDEGFKALVTYLCVSKNKKTGFVELPDGFWDINDSSLPVKLETIGRYFLVDTLGLKTAADIEGFKNYSREAPRNRLAQLLKQISYIDLVKLLSPGYMDGPNPPIREWCTAAAKKWQGKEEEQEAIFNAATRACKNVVLEQGVVNEDRTLDFERIADTNWGQVFWDVKYGLRGALGNCPYLQNALDGLELAIPGLIGSGIGQIPRAKFQYPGKWDDKNRLAVIDELTKYIVETKLKLLDENGEVSANKIKEIKDWATQYNDECTGCLQRAGVGNAHEALKRVYPHLFGWGNNQIQPGDITYSRMWLSAGSERLFALKFGKSIEAAFNKLKQKALKNQEGCEEFKNHSVIFNPSAPCPLYISRKDFNALNNYYMSHGISWTEHVSAFNLTAGFRDIAGGNFVKAFEILFGKADEETGRFGYSNIYLEDIQDRNPTRTMLVANLLADLPYDFDETKIKLSGVPNRKDDYVPGTTGVENTCLQPLLAYRSESDVFERTSALYEAFKAAILPSLTEDTVKDDEGGRIVDRATALEKLLEAEYLSGPVLSDRRLRHLLRALVEDDYEIKAILDNVSLDDDTKVKLKSLVNKLLALKRPANNPREVLLTACKMDRKYGANNNLLAVLNGVLEIVFRTIAIHEIRYEKINGNNSAHFNRVLGFIHVRDKERKAREKEDKEYRARLKEESKVKEKDEKAEAKITKRLVGKSKAARAAAMDAAQEALAGDFSPCPDWEKFYGETVKICNGKAQERPEILNSLIEIARDKSRFKDRQTDFFCAIDSGDLLIQIRMLYQLCERSQLRFPDRYDYSSLRAKPLNAGYIETIVDSETNTIRDLDFIEKDLFSCIPEWWPHKDRIPLAVPLLYRNNTLYVGAQESVSPQVEKFIQNNLRDCRIEMRTIRSDSWLNLLGFYKKHVQIRVVNPECPPRKQFIGFEEEDQIIENITAMRIAASELMKMEKVDLRRRQSIN